MAGIGNNNVHRGPNQDKKFRAALNRAIEAAGGDPDQLQRIGATLLDQAELGNMSAITIIRDTLDGKPAQEITGQGGGPLEIAYRTVYEDKDKDGA